MILSGGPSSACTPRARRRSTRRCSRPASRCSGICYGFQAMAQALGGAVEHTGAREYGRTELTVVGRDGVLLRRPARTRQTGVDVATATRSSAAPDRVRRSPRRRPARRSRRSRTSSAASPACSSTPRCCTPRTGSRCSSSFLLRRRRDRADWTTASIVDDQVAAIRAQVGDGRVICGLSGGVDSAVAAALVQRAVGDQLTCVFVDHGLLREGEAEQVERDFVAATGVRLHGRRRAPTGSSTRSPGVTDPEEKRKIIGREFIRVFEAGGARGRRRGGEHGERSTSSCRARSTRTSSSPAAAPAPRTSRATTTSAACRTTCSSRWSSRCARCSRTRCARSARSSGCPQTIVWRQPFPGPGLGHPHHRRGHPRAARRAARGRRDRPRRS